MEILAIDPKTKICSKCKIEKSLDEFYKSLSSQYCRRPECKKCSSKYALNRRKLPEVIERRKKYWGNYKIKNAKKLKKSYEKNKEKYNTARRAIYANNRNNCVEKLRKYYREHTQSRLWYSAKRRAKRLNIKFTIKKEDITVPEKCPVFGFRLIVNKGNSGYNSPSLDRINTHKGYTPDNIIVVSHKANTIKNNATIKEIAKVLDFYRRILCQ